MLFNLRLKCCTCNFFLIYDRLELSDINWSSEGYYKTFGELSEGLMIDSIERVDATKITVEEFKNYEGRHVPVLLTGLTDSWSANQKWTVPVRLLRIL